MCRNRLSLLCVALAIVCMAGLATVRSQGTGVVQSSEDPEQITFTGKVVDGRGQPVAGVKVGLHTVSYGDAVQTYDVRLVQEVTTQADGAFSFSAVKSEQYQEGVILAQREGLATGWASWRMRQDQQHDIRLGEPKQLSGAVVDEDNEPLADAKVFIASGKIGEKEDEQQYLLGPVGRRLLTTKTDAAGKFTFVGLPAEASFEVGVEKPGYATMTSIDWSRRREDVLQFSPGQPGIKLVVPVEAKIAGTVVEPSTGKPVAGATIMVRGTRMRGYFQPAPCISQADGTFTIDSLVPDAYTVQLAAARRELADWVAEPVSVTLEAGQAKTDVRMEVSKGGLLEVVVTEAETNKPLEGVRVSVYDQRRQQSFGGQTDEQGVGRVRLLPGEYQMSGVYKQGYTHQERRVTITIEQGATKRMACTLTETPRVRGVVRDAAGKPLQGVDLRVLPGGGEGVRSDSQGQFEIIWDPGFWGERDTIFCLVAREEQHNLAAIVEIDEGTKTLDIKLKPGVTFTGKVVDPNDKGIAGARVRMMLRVSNWGSSLSRSEAEADDSGNFEIRAIPAGHRYNLYASAAGYGESRIEVHADDAVNNRLDVGALTLPVANLSVSGRVVDTEGNPVPHARIDASGYGEGQPNRLSTQADPEGNFTLDGVCAGTINIRVDVERDGKRLSARVVTDGGASGIKIVVREGRSVVQYISAKTYEQVIQSGDKVIAGAAVDENGSPVAGVPVGVCCHKKKREDGRFTWMFSSFETLRDTTDEQGRFAIKLEEDGEYNLRFSPDNHAAIIVYDIPVGKKDLKVTLPEGGTVTGRLVRLERGEKVPIPNVEVKIEQTDRASYTHLGFDRDRTTVTDSQGRFRFEHVRTKIRPHESMSAEQWEHTERVWQISYGNTSKAVAFYGGTKTEEIELVVKPGPEDAQPLAGRALPELKDLGIELSPADTEGRMILVCFWDMQQRPSRYCLRQLAEHAEQLKQKGVAIVAVQASQVEQASLNEWVKKYDIPFPVGRVETGAEGTRLAWGVHSLPWLILTDSKHVVVAEGFQLGELNEKITKGANYD